MVTQVELKPYSFPPGMAIPRLMPFQEWPFNNDQYIAAEVIRLKEAHGLKYAFETGTCLGSTALWLSEQFDHVFTYEIHEPTWTIAHERTKGKNITCRLMASVSGLNIHAAGKGFYFLDAHWGDHCPLLDEMEVISHRGPNGCILIHDFQVPGTDFGFDSMPDGRPFNLDLIRGHLDKIYGEGKWKHNYPTEVAGARRGWISIEPCS